MPTETLKILIKASKMEDPEANKTKGVKTIQKVITTGWASEATTELQD